MSQPTSLAAWLAYLETLHPKAISLGLERVRAVHDRLALAPACPVVTVTGTNGKGSTSAFLERMLSAGGYRIGLYMSPHLLRYNERVRIGGAEATDAELCAAFAAVEAVRQDIPLTYFEFGTLAALWLFARVRTDALVLEVGLGGRLDAVNIVDADVAVVTTIAIDHIDYLGITREDIGREKAGIFRAGRVAVCADPDPPTALVDHARAIGAVLLRLGVDFGFVAEQRQWRYFGPGGARHGLPYPALRGTYQLANAAAALTALDALRTDLPVDMGAVRDALVSIELPGRFQVLPGRPVTVLDVAHNVQAARALADTVAAMGFHPQTLAVFGIMADKDIDAVIAALKPRVDRWLVATLPPPRGATAMLLRRHLEQAGVGADAIRTFDDAGAAYRAAREIAAEADRIIVFGSFLTVAAALA
ncbi:MAG TPA: bifunctional tetrahydrofolate synthase/dihydrofolate synthase [Casimicrobiaceae bacterium]|jgi:dihydrofolate synthase/folylpolyglutamate synthase|nr:bifunctional tetrahydrofolate synthase/dihydrofolate synthase [Casimicrobiaceae bacterium]